MKKILLIALTLFTVNAYAQIEVRKPGETTNLDGDTVVYTADLSDVPLDDEFAVFEGPKFHVYNLTANDLSLRIKRYRVDVPTDWKDNLCWPPTCFNNVQNSESNGYYITPNAGAYTAPIVVAGGTANNYSAHAEIKPQYYPRNLGTSALYKYVVTSEDGTTDYAEVYVKINYNDPLSTLTVSKAMELTIAPNPATDFVNIQAEGMAASKLKVVDVLGNVVYAADFNNAKKINTTEFKSGVYFITIQNAANKSITKKFVVR